MMEDEVVDEGDIEEVQNRIGYGNQYSFNITSLNAQMRPSSKTSATFVIV